MTPSERRPFRRTLFTRLLMLQTIRAPRRGLQACRLDRTAINDAPAEGAGIESADGLSHLCQRRRIRIRLGKILRRSFVGGADITRISGNIEKLLAPVLRFAVDPCG